MEAYQYYGQLNFTAAGLEMAYRMCYPLRPIDAGSRMVAMVAHFRLAKQIVREDHMRKDIQADQLVQAGAPYQQEHLGIAN